jgi:ferric-chelate reductase
MFCTDIELAIGFEKIREECEHDGFESLDWQQLVANITHDDIAHIKVVEFDEIPAGTNTTEPVRLSKTFFGRVGNTLVCISRLLLLLKRLTLTDDLGI